MTKNRRFEWERAIVNSKLHPTTRHVAHVYAIHMDPDGICWPGTFRVHLETGLGQRTVQKHNKILRDSGWLRRGSEKKTLLGAFGRACGCALKSECTCAITDHLGKQTREQPTTTTTTPPTTRESLEEESIDSDDTARVPTKSPAPSPFNPQSKPAFDFDQKPHTESRACSNGYARVTVVYKGKPVRHSHPVETVEEFVGYLKRLGAIVTDHYRNPMSVTRIRQATVAA